MTFLDRIKNGFWLQKESLTLTFKHPQLLLYWILITGLWLGTSYLFFSHQLFSLSYFKLFLIFRNIIIMIIWVVCINHMKNILQGNKTTLKNAYRMIATLALSILAVIVMQELVSYAFKSYALSAPSKAPELAAFYAMLQNFPIINLIFWLPTAFVSLLLTVMVFENVQIIKAFGIAIKVIFHNWLQILLWILVLMFLDIIASSIFGSFIILLDPTNLKSAFFMSKLILIARNLIRFIFGLTFIVQLYNSYRKEIV